MESRSRGSNPACLICRIAQAMLQCNIMPMFSAIIRARPDPLALTATLSPLVRGVVEGMVGSAYLVADAQSAMLDEIADSAGCGVIIAPNWPDGFARAVAITKGTPLLVLDAGVMIGPEFWHVLADRLAYLGAAPAISRAKAGWSFSQLFSRMPKSDRALILPGSIARQIASARADPWRWRYGKLVELPVETRRAGV